MHTFFSQTHLLGIPGYPIFCKEEKLLQQALDGRTSGFPRCLLGLNQPIKAVKEIKYTMRFSSITVVI